MTSSNHLEILVEEQSMAAFLHSFLPRIIPKEYAINQNCFIRPHQGKSDLQKSIRIKTKALSNYALRTKFIILHDLDSHPNCKVLKNHLKSLIYNPDSNALIRIPCRELENWYLGDLASIEAIYPSSKASKFSNKSKYASPDNLHGSNEMKILCPDFSKIYCARKIAPIINLDSNRSMSFNQFVSGIQQFLSSCE